MTASPARLRAIVLAAERGGTLNPLAARFGVSHKCLVPLRGKPLIAHVVETLAHDPRVAAIAISVEQEAFEEVRSALPANDHGTPIEFTASADNLADSVFAATGLPDEPVLITTADNALLAHRSIELLAEALTSADAAIAMAPREAVLATHPQGQRRFYEFRDGAYSNCNLYGINGAKAFGAAEVFRGGGQFAKSAMRIVGAFGLLNLICLRLKLYGLQGALARVSRRLG